jgi:IclR family acetate operon transcriptional repressor
LIDKVHSSRSVQTVSQIGQRAPMYMTASGWAFLSRLDREQIGAYLPDELVASTSLTITDRDELLGEIDQVRRRGYAINPGRWRADVAAIASAIVDKTDRPIGAVSISMPSYRLVPDLYERYGERVRLATEKLSMLL